MANLRIKTGSGADAYLAGSGAGTDADPFVPTNVIVADAPLEVTGPLTKAQLDQSVVTVTGNLDLAPEVVPMFSYVSYSPQSFEGDLEIIAAPGAGLRIVVDEIFFQNEMGVPCNIVVKSGGSTYRRVRLVGDGDWMQWVFPTGKELRLPENSNLAINKAGLTQLGIILRTRLESV
jgi:hypothetical protein